MGQSIDIYLAGQGRFDRTIAGIRVRVHPGVNPDDQGGGPSFVAEGFGKDKSRIIEVKDILYLRRVPTAIRNSGTRVIQWGRNTMARRRGHG
ncbi:hypothetical protein D477_000650 [Arthrobacter crystallopoietes BAB-32]|uniref:Uncharacterized protein n=1 Tax=Arthrobacter crystallopoietes BAB-32 TaxID=1246476 RepID=N1V7Q7_9MICC|nr:hypothetical protein [Arthrobacter crystallopoietes]EMY36147.1 hypothetical protein D477_000650 [Arthrobacter crystallopoietes BAB-32]